MHGRLVESDKTVVKWLLCLSLKLEDTLLFIYVYAVFDQEIP